MPAAARWVALALLGLLIAAGVSIAASGLVSQQIGLASEPISAGDALAPQASARANRHEPPRHKASPVHPPAEPAPGETTAPPPVSVEAQPPASPPSTLPAVPAPSGGAGTSGGEQDHGGGGSGHADD